MIQTPVGFRCPECAQERTQVRSGVAAVNATGGTPATIGLIAANVIVFLLTIATGSGGFSSIGGPIFQDFSLLGYAVADGEWYRIITGGFLHAGFMHLAFNMFALFFLGKVLEPSIGTPRFLLVYFASLLAGSFGALVVSGSGTPTVGASGAVFGIFGAVFVIAQGRGLTDLAREVGLILGINLVLTFSISGISIGGHIGGLIAGLICGAIVVAGERGRFGSNARFAEYAAMVVIAVVCAVGAIAVSEPFPTQTFIIGLLG